MRRCRVRPEKTTLAVGVQEWLASAARGWKIRPIGSSVGVVSVIVLTSSYEGQGMCEIGGRGRRTVQ